MAEPSRQSFGIRLRRAPTRQLRQLLAEHASEMTVREVRLVLRNPFTTAEVIEELLCLKRLLSAYEVRSAIARHRRTPETAAMRFISGLYWRDLLEISIDVRISPAVRRVAEKYLTRRLGRLALGEKIAVARRAPAEILIHLSKDPSRHVIKALLENTRLTEQALLPLVANESTLPTILDLVASSPRWGARYEIRVALSCNSRSPFRVIFAILPTLLHRDLLAVAARESHSSVVRCRVRELLEEPRPAPQDGPPDTSPGSDPTIYI